MLVPEEFPMKLISRMLQTSLPLSQRTAFCAAASLFVIASSGCTQKNPGVANLLMQSAQAETAVPDTCAEAQMAFSKQEWTRMSTLGIQCAKEAPADEEVQNNMRMLFRAAFAETQGLLSADTQLGKTLQDVKIELRNAGKSGGEEGRVKLQVKYSTPVGAAQIQHLELINVNGETLLSLDSSDEKDSSVDDGLEHHWISQKLDKAPPDGFVTLKIQLVGESLYEVAVPFLDLQETGSVKLLSPTESAALNTRQPVIQWTQCPSGAKGFFEGKAMAKIFSVSPEGEWKDAWARYSLPNNVTKVQSGVTPGGEGFSELPDGSYVAWIKCTQARRFGAVSLHRGSRDAVTFSVAKD